MSRLLIVQSDPVFGAVAKNIDAVRHALAGRRADLVVLPELFAAGYQFASRDEVESLAEPAPGGPSAAALEAIAAETGALVVGGLAERAEDGRIYNAAAIVAPGGFLACYRKLHLFHEERTWFARGERLPPVVWTPSGLRVGVMICFDWRFPEVMRFLALEGADVVAHPSNLVRPHCPDAMVTRCLENVCFGATANRVGEEARGGRPPLRYIGRSQVVSPRGERLGALGAEGAGILEVVIDPAEARRKSVTGCEDLFAARRSDALSLAPRRDAATRRATLSRHVEKGGEAHLDLFLEKEDGSLMAFHLDAPPRPGLVATRTFDHRPVYLNFEGDLSEERGTVTVLERGMCRETGRDARPDAAGTRELEVRLGASAFRIHSTDSAKRWQVT